MKKTTYLELILYSVLLTFTVALFSAVSVITQADDTRTLLLQITAFAVMSVFFTLYTRKSAIHFGTADLSLTKTTPYYLIFLVLIVLVQPFILGIRPDLPLTTILLTIVQMSLVGYTEELLFRKIFFEKLRTKKPLVYILFSAVVFGLLHSASGINPETPPFFVLLQVVNALLLGIVFAMIYYLSKNIGLLMLFHMLFNTFASFTNTGSTETEALAVIVLSVIYLSAILLLYPKLNQINQEKQKLS